MVCATIQHNSNSEIIMTKDQMEQQHHTIDFDMAMEEEEDSDEDSSQDEISSTPSSSSGNANKRPMTQALFLNFTSDLSPQKMNKKKSKPKKQTAYRVNGVNILNRNNLDSKTAIERIQRRRENHNHVERRRRDNINNTIFELSSVVPNAIQPGQKPNKGNILKLSLDYIKELQQENNALKERLAHYTSSISPPLASSASIPAVDEPFNTIVHPSPSAPSSPHYVRTNPAFTQQSISVPTSPLHNTTTIKKEERLHTPNNLPPPLSLPPPQQQLQSVFSSMSVSSNTSSAASTPTTHSALPALIHTNDTHNNSSNTGYPYPSYSYAPQQQQTLFNTTTFNGPPPPSSSSSSSTNAAAPPILKSPHHTQQSLRPLLPATKPHHPPAIQNHQTAFLPSLRMSGYEKIYGNVCRY